MLLTEKPLYAVPALAETLATPATGPTHISTFSGAGGTSLGFRMAGFRTLIAVDINRQAAATYAANLPSPILVGDLRALSGGELMARTGLAQGELDVLEGSPPCTAFSTAGHQAAGWHRTKEHAGTVQANVEDLFFDWLRLLDELRPRSFVAENVTGLVRGVSKGYFKTILQRMTAIGYWTEARILDAQWLGVPQRRPRVIFIGIRNDQHRRPAFPAPWPYQYSVRDALPHIFSVPKMLTGHELGSSTARQVSPTITADGFDGKAQAKTVRVVHDQHGQFQSGGDITRRPSVTVTAGGQSHFTVVHDTGGFMSEGNVARKPSPALLAQRSDLTVQSGTSKRRITIDELKRLCSFPDDYVMTGSYGQQWAQLGNAVPPLMARAIAVALREVLDARP